MQQCETCLRWFVHGAAAAQHMNALNHWAERFECDTCDEEFLDEDECEEHMDDYGHHGPEFECEYEHCPRAFYTQQQARQHMDDTGHWRNHWCRECQRGFQNANNLRMHLNSAIHRGGSLSCPFCRRSHATASGIVHHLENNSCPKAQNVDRETIYAFIREKDPHGAITNRQLTWHSHENGTFIASAASWNGRNYECYLCHRGFGQLRSLNQHLESPAHKQKIYHCFGRGCDKQFTALAALFNHLESESCGATRFGTVQKNVGGILTGRKMIGF